MAEIPIERKPRRSVGPLLLVLIVILLAVAGWYWWTNYGNRNGAATTTSSLSPQTLLGETFFSSDRHLYLRRA